jgi:hypothetical protein
MTLAFAKSNAIGAIDVPLESMAHVMRDSSIDLSM